MTVTTHLRTDSSTDSKSSGTHLNLTAENLSFLDLSTNLWSPHKPFNILNPQSETASFHYEYINHPQIKCPGDFDDLCQSFGTTVISIAAAICRSLSRLLLAPHSTSLLNFPFEEFCHAPSFSESVVRNAAIDEYNALFFSAFINMSDFVEAVRIEPFI